jgi:cell wall-associated NlpC family hydrolase
VNLSVAAGVAGTVAITGTVMAVASDQPSTPRLKPVSFDRDSVSTTTGALQLKQAAVENHREQAHEAALQRLAEAKKRAAAKRERARKLAAKRAAEARQQSSNTASRSFSRVDGPMSASAAHVLQLAANAASGAYYTYGGDGPNGFDCSGFTQYVFNQVGISLPHSAAAQSGVATRVSNPAPGDLVFVYNGGGGSIGHVAIYAGNGYWWEASNPGTGVGKHRAWSSNVSYGRVL